MATGPCPTTSGPPSDQPGCSNRPPAWPLLVLLAMAAAYATLAVGVVRDKSVTVDEFGHLPAGFNLLTTGDFRYCELNPPLMNALNALPVLASAKRGDEFAPSAGPAQRFSFWSNGYPFMNANAAIYQQLFERARFVTVALVGLLGVLLFYWARLLTSSRAPLAGLLAAGLVWFSPGILAHATLVTTDAGAAAFVAFTLFCFHLYLRHPGWGRALLLGLALGLAQLVKFSAVYLYPVLVLQWLLWRTLRPQTGEAADNPPAQAGAARPLAPPRELWRLLAVFIVSLAAINAGYLFQGSFRPVGEISLHSGPLKALARMLPAATPSPLPIAFVEAFDRQLADTAAGDPSYLFGESYEGGRWYYFVALLAIKTPLPLLALAGLALFVGLRGDGLRSVPTLLLLPPAIAFVLIFSLFSNKQLGLRMILPAAPLFWLWAATALAAAPPARWRRVVVAGLTIWLAVEVALIHPNHLTCFNQLVGGPRNGYRCAVDSNLDWGQDLIGLKRWMDAQRLESLQLYYFGRPDPQIYGISYRLPRHVVEPGYVAISASLLGRPYVLNDHGEPFLVGPLSINPAVFGEPVAQIGNTIRVYRLDQPVRLDALRQR